MEDQPLLLRHPPKLTKSMKPIALSIRGDEAAATLNLLERTAKALRTCAVDDVHLGNRLGALLNALVMRLQQKILTSKGGNVGNYYRAELVKNSGLPNTDWY